MYYKIESKCINQPAAKNSKQTGSIDKDREVQFGLNGLNLYDDNIISMRRSREVGGHAIRTPSLENHNYRVPYQYWSEFCRKSQSYQAFVQC